MKEQHVLLYREVCYIYSPVFVSCADMGNGQQDDSQQATSKQQQPALNTTRLLNKYLSDTDLVLHIGDISYADGYSPVVSDTLFSELALYGAHPMSMVKSECRKQ